MLIDDLRNLSDALRISVELKLAYLNPAFVTRTNLIVRTYEQNAALVYLIHKEIEEHLLILLVEELARERAAIQQAMIEHDNYLQKWSQASVQNFYAVNMMMEYILKKMKELQDFNEQLSALKEKLVLLHSNITLKIEKLNEFKKILEDDTDRRYKYLAKFVEHKFAQVHIDGLYKLNVDIKTKKTISIDVNDILYEVRQAILEKIKNREGNIDIDAEKIVDSFIRKKFANLLANLPPDQRENLPDVDTLMQNNSKEISKIKLEVNNNINHMHLGDQSQTQFDYIKRNELMIKKISEKTKEYSEILQFSEETPKNMDSILLNINHLQASLKQLQMHSSEAISIENENGTLIESKVSSDATTLSDGMKNMQEIDKQADTITNELTFDFDVIESMMLEVSNRPSLEPEFEEPEPQNVHGSYVEILRNLSENSPTPLDFGNVENKSYDEKSDSALTKKEEEEKDHSDSNKLEKNIPKEQKADDPIVKPGRNLK